MTTLKNKAGKAHRVSHFYYDESVFDDVRAPIITTKISGVRPPTFAKYKDNGAGSTGINLYRFSATAVNEVFGAVELPHRYALAGEIIPHVHWIPDDNGAGDVVFELEYTLAVIDGIFGDTTVSEITVPTDTTDDKHMLNNFAGLVTTGLEPSTAILFRFARLGNDGDDSYGNVVWVPYVDFHFEADTPGTLSAAAHTDK